MTGWTGQLSLAHRPSPGSARSPPPGSAPPPGCPSRSRSSPAPWPVPGLAAVAGAPAATCSTGIAVRGRHPGLFRRLHRHAVPLAAVRRWTAEDRSLGPPSIARSLWRTPLHLGRRHGRRPRLRRPCGPRPLPIGAAAMIATREHERAAVALGVPAGRPLAGFTVTGAWPGWPAPRPTSSRPSPSSSSIPWLRSRCFRSPRWAASNRCGERSSEPPSSPWRRSRCARCRPRWPPPCRRPYCWWSSPCARPGWRRSPRRSFVRAPVLDRNAPYPSVRTDSLRAGRRYGGGRPAG